MTAAICPSTGLTGISACPWLSMLATRRAKLRGWAAAGLTVAALMAGCAVLASSVPAPTLVEPVAIQLAPTPMAAVAPAISAVPEPAPERPAEEISEPEPPKAEQPPPALASQDPLPTLAPPPPRLAVPMVPQEPQVIADDPAPPKPIENPVKAPAKPASPKAKKTDSPKKAQKKQQKAPSQPAASAQAGAKAAAKSAAATSPKTWASTVAKQIRKTPKTAVSGHGTVLIGFTVAPDGGLAGAKVLKSSGDPAIDRMGLDHIRRAAPFPPPPPDAGRNLSFAFELR